MRGHAIVGGTQNVRLRGDGEPGFCGKQAKCSREEVEGKKPQRLIQGAQGSEGEKNTKRG